MSGCFAVFIFILLCISVLLIATKFALDAWDKRRPSNEWLEDPFYGLEKPVFYQGTLLDESAKGTGEALLLPISAYVDHIDPDIFVEEDGVTVTTEDTVIHFRTEQLTALMNDRPMELKFPLQKIDEQLYLPVDPLIELYGLEIRESEETGAVLIWREGDVITWGEILSPQGSPVRIREENHIKAKIVYEADGGEAVMIYDEDDGWYRVQFPNGYFGYVNKNNVRLDHTEKIPEVVRKSAHVAWKPLGGKINLTWEAVYNVPPKPENIGPMPGLNVISPTWFELGKNKDGQFYVKNKADPAYVKWAHERGYQVWALFSNSFDPDLTTEMLSSYDTRMGVIREIAHFAQMYHLQGINIDFENVYLEDKDRFTQFVREMTPILREQGLVVSIDVTIRGGSPMWSLFYDREKLGQVVDYMIVMTYDEHWASSPVAGSVASLPWVEKGMTDIMEHDKVPASKLILGVPFYTRIWTEETDAEGNVKVTSRAVSMREVEETIERHGLTPVFLEDLGQHYVEFEEDGKTHKIWIEDETSMRLRAQLVNKYNFAGIASWRRGFEKPEIWNVIHETLSKNSP